MAFFNELSNTSTIVSSFSKNPLYDFGIYAKGYQESANILSVQFMNKTNFGDYEGYPIVFLYRHAFELSLKNIIYSGIKLCKLKNITNINNKLYNNHDLENLACDAKKILDVLFNDYEIGNMLKRLISFAKEFSEIDPNSYSYRYPIDKKGDCSTPRNQAVNIESIYTNMNKILNEINIIDFGLNIETDQIEAIRKILV